MGVCALMVSSQLSQNKKRKAKVEKTDKRKLIYNCLIIIIWIQENGSLLMRFQS